jgi:hypothetical protein
LDLFFFLGFALQVVRGAGKSVTGELNMKTPIIAVSICLILIASTGFGQGTPSSATMQMRGASMMMNPDGRSYNGTATIAPPTFPIMVLTGVPFSAEEIGSQTQILPDGNRITRAMPSVFLFRDSAGRTRTERPAMIVAPNSKLTVKLPLIPEIYDPVAGYQYFLDTANRVAHRYTIPPSKSPQYRPDTLTGINVIHSEGNPQANTPASVSEPLGTQMIEGILAEGRRTTMTFPMGMMDNDKPMMSNNEYWTSVDLKVTVLTRQYDPRGGESLRALINIDRTEPDSKLFQVPPDYKIIDETGVFTITFSSIKQ